VKHKNAMKAIRAFIWRYRRRLLALAIIIGLAMTFTFPRQLVFGPRIQGSPWCWWEHEIRLLAHWNRPPDGWIDVLHRELRLGERHVGRGLNFRDPSALPILLELAEDEDVKVRLWCLQQIGQLRFHAKIDDDLILPLFKRVQRDDNEMECRLDAAAQLLWLTKDPEMLKFITDLAEGEDFFLRRLAVRDLHGSGKEFPELFDLFKRRLDDEDAETRKWAIHGIGYCGKRGLAILREWLHDEDRAKMKRAAYIACHMKGDAIELAPDLLLLGADRDREFARHVLENLRFIDPVNYPHGAWVVE
jgi:hypothetical protein